MFSLGPRSYTVEEKLRTNCFVGVYTPNRNYWVFNVKKCARKKIYGRWLDWSNDLIYRNGQKDSIIPKNIIRDSENNNFILFNLTSCGKDSYEVPLDVHEVLLREVEQVFSKI